MHSCLVSCSCTVATKKPHMKWSPQLCLLPAGGSQWSRLSTVLTITQSLISCIPSYLSQQIVTGNTTVAVSLNTSWFVRIRWENMSRGVSDLVSTLLQGITSAVISIWQKFNMSSTTAYSIKQQMRRTTIKKLVIYEPCSVKINVDTFSF